MAERWRTIGSRLGLAATGLVVALVAAEVVIRVLGLSTTLSSYRHPEMVKYGQLFRRGDDPVLPLVVPNAQATIKGIPFRINSRGFRDREFPLERPAGVVRIACLGDSVTFGLDVALEASYPKRLEEGLRQAGLRAEALNFGANHFDLPQHVEHYRRKVAAFSPDVLVLQLGLNDFPRWWRGRETPPGGGPPPGGAVPAGDGRREGVLKRVARNSALYLVAAERYNYLVARMGGRRPIMEMYATRPEDWAYARELLGPMFTDLKRRGVSVVLAYFPYDFEVNSERPELEEPRRELASLARSQGVEFVDLTPDLRAARSAGRPVFLDDAHLTPWGNAVAAEAVQRAVTPLVRRIVAARAAEARSR